MLNTITLRGILMDDLTATTSINGNTTYNGTIAVARKSGVVDYLPVSLDAQKVPNLNPFDLRGQHVTATGKIKTITRNDEEVGHRHKVTACIDSLYASNGMPDEQHVALEGALCKPPKFRVTPFGREICELLVACNHGINSSFIPAICWGCTARRMAKAEVGDLVELTGRFQSRKYEKKMDAVEASVWRTAYEVSAKTCRVFGVQRRMMADV